MNIYLISQRLIRPWRKKRHTSLPRHPLSGEFFQKKRRGLTYRILSIFIAFTFTFSVIMPPQAQAQVASPTILNLPPPGTMISTTASFTPALVKGITVYPDNPLEFDFIVSRGDSGIEDKELRSAATKLIKYFLASLTVPNEELWVNLSPYEKDRIITKGFGDTEMGRDMLAQDYMLKQLTASLMYPEDELGQDFWNRVYKKAYEKYGTTEIPMNTFNKVWIVPQRADVYEHENSVFVANSRLKVMLEEDYVALRNEMSNATPLSEAKGVTTNLSRKIISGISSDIVREILIPEIEREVNEGETFANLRQIYNSTILATWYKMNFQKSLLGQVYANKNKTKGVDVEDKQINQKIYKQYVESFKKGVYNYIREDYDPATRQVIPRKYFSGGSVINPEGVIRVVSSGIGLKGDVDKFKIYLLEASPKNERFSQERTLALAASPIKKIKNGLDAFEKKILSGEQKISKESLRELEKFEERLSKVSEKEDTQNDVQNITTKIESWREDVDIILNRRNIPKGKDYSAFLTLIDDLADSYGQELEEYGFELMLDEIEENHWTFSIKTPDSRTINFSIKITPDVVKSDGFVAHNLDAKKSNSLKVYLQPEGSENLYVIQLQNKKLSTYAIPVASSAVAQLPDEVQLINTKLRAKHWLINLTKDPVQEDFREEEVSDSGKLTMKSLPRIRYKISRATDNFGHLDLYWNEDKKYIKMDIELAGGYTDNGIGYTVYNWVVNQALKADMKEIRISTRNTTALRLAQKMLTNIKVGAVGQSFKILRAPEKSITIDPTVKKILDGKKPVELKGTPNPKTEIFQPGAHMLRKMAKLRLEGRRVFMRVDFNATFDEETGEIVSKARIDANTPTIVKAFTRGAKTVILGTHAFRPDGKVIPAMSTEPLIHYYRKRFKGKKVEFLRRKQNETPEAYLDRADRFIKEEKPDILLLDNLRFDPRETSEDPEERKAMAKQLKKLADVFINDAFSIVHRQHASVYELADLFDRKDRGAGPALMTELENLHYVLDIIKNRSALEQALAVIAGSKLAGPEGKIHLLKGLGHLMDSVEVGGLIALTFLKMKLVEKGLYDIPAIIDQAREEVLRLEGELSQIQGIQKTKQHTTIFKDRLKKVQKNLEKAQKKLKDVLSEQTEIEEAREVFEYYKKFNLTPPMIPQDYLAVPKKPTKTNPKQRPERVTIDDFLSGRIHIGDYNIIDLEKDSLAYLKQKAAGSKFVLLQGSLGYTEIEDGKAGMNEFTQFLSTLDDVITVLAGGNTVADAEDAGLSVETAFSKILLAGGAASYYLIDIPLPGLQPLLDFQALRADARKSSIASSAITQKEFEEAFEDIRQDMIFLHKKREDAIKKINQIAQQWEKDAPKREEIERTITNISGEFTELIEQTIGQDDRIAYLIIQILPKDGAPSPDEIQSRLKSLRKLINLVVAQKIFLDFEYSIDNQETREGEELDDADIDEIRELAEKAAKTTKNKGVKKDIKIFIEMILLASSAVGKAEKAPTLDPIANTGGINFNPELLDLQIKRDGNGVPLPLEMQPIENMNIDGFIPIIINVTPINLPMMLGLSDALPVDNTIPAEGNTSGKISFIDKYRNKFLRENGLTEV